MQIIKALQARLYVVEYLTTDKINLKPYLIRKVLRHSELPKNIRKQLEKEQNSELH